MANTTKTVVVPGLGDSFPMQGSQFSVFNKGTDIYDELRVGREVVVQNEAKTKQVRGSIVSLRVGALIDLLNEFGPYNVTTFGKPYTPLMLIQTMTDIAAVEALDVSKLYTVFTVSPSGAVEDVAPAQ